jgi:hypothetical protein
MTNLDNTTETPKLKIRETITKVIDKEVSLPYFFMQKEGYCCYKIISDSLAVAVNNFPNNRISIEVRKSVNHFIEDSIEITQQDFEEMEAAVMFKIQNQTL